MTSILSSSKTLNDRQYFENNWYAKSLIILNDKLMSLFMKRTGVIKNNDKSKR